MSATKSEIQSTKRKRVTNNAEVSDRQKKLITQGKTVKTKVEQKKGDSQKLNDGNQDSSRSGNNSWSREDQNKSINGQEDIKKQSQLKNKKNTVQSVNKKIPPIAQLSADIILKIAEYPKKQELERASLVDQICAMIEQFSTNYEQVDPQYFEQIKPKVERLKRIFGEGIERGYAFCQQRIKDAANIPIEYQDQDSMITFNPTHTVTGQIMRQLVYGRIQNYSISFGHQGIAKTFAYYLYHQLSNIFISQVINCKCQDIKQFFEQKKEKEKSKLKIFKIPKLIYWTMKIYSNNKQDWLNQELKSLFLIQCSEIKDELMTGYQQLNFFQFVEKICKLYRTKGITVYLIVDQINKIASCFRNYFIIEQQSKKKPSLREEKLYKDNKKKYQLAAKLNDFRQGLFSINEGFHCIFYNSSVNMETFFKFDEPSKDAYNDIRKQLKLYRQQDHAQKRSLTHRIFYPEIVKLDSSIWSLADTIIFELKKLNKLSVSKQQMNALRKKIFDFLKEKNSSVVITFLRIAGAIQVKYLNKQIKFTAQNIQVALGAILEQVEKQEKDWLKDNLAKFKQKVVDPEERLEAIALIYDYMYEKQQKQQQAQMIKTQTGMMELSFLNCPISLGTKTFLLNNLNRHLFLFFENNDLFNKYFSQLEKTLKENLSSWFGKQFQSQQFQLLSKSIQNKNPNDREFGFSLLPPDSVIQLLKPEMRQLSTIKSETYKKILLRFQSSTLASVLEVQLVDYLKTTRKIAKFKSFSYPYTQYKELKQLIELPKKNFEADRIINQNIEFLAQFFIEDNQRENNSYLFIPETETSNSVDFAIQNISIHEKIQIYTVHLCQVTFLTDMTKLSQKINLFIQSFRAAETQFEKNFELNGVKMNIYFVLIGDNMNDNGEMEKLISPMNNQLKKHKSKFLKQITYQSFNEIDLPDCSQFFGAIRQTMKKKYSNTPKMNSSVKKGKK